MTLFGTSLSPNVEHVSAKKNFPFNWDDVWLFLRVAELGSFRAASAESGVSVNKIRRRIEILEQTVASTLLVRTPNGVTVTDQGKQVFAVGAEMYQNAVVLKRVLGADRSKARAVVRLGVTEGLGTFWLIPRLRELYEANKSIQVDLRCEMRMPDISRLEVDVSVQLDRPRDPNLIVVRLGYLHLMLFASHDYLARYGEPRSVADVAKFKFVELMADQIPSERLNQAVPDADPREFVSLRTNTSSAHAFAIAQGTGIGALPTYARAVTTQVRPVVPDYHFARDIWLVYHPSAGEHKGVRQVIDWLRQSFDPQRYPWFSEQFHSPEEIDTILRKYDVSRLFSGFNEPATSAI